MSKPKYNLGDFIETVPSCLQTATLTMAWDILSQGQSDRLVVLNRQRSPLGVLHLRQLLSQGLQPTSNSKNTKQPLSKATDRLLEPVEILPAQLSLEQFQLYLDSRSDGDIDRSVAIVDAKGKFLGLLESAKLWKFLATARREGDRVVSSTSIEATIDCGIELAQLDPIVQMLEKLPLPLMLQTSFGEVIVQNPAWNRQFGNMGNSEAVRQEVEAILNLAATQPSAIESKSAMLAEVIEAGGESNRQSIDWSAAIDRSSLTALQEQLSLLSAADAANNAANNATNSDTIHYCQQGEEEGTCICVCPGQHGQDRVWQFLKIPLQISVVSQQQQSERIWLLMATDVTEQQQMASELAAKNADLIQLNRLKDEFLACISHELRTPLTAMLGLSTLLKDQALGQLNERQARYARLIHENGRHLMSVVNDILDLTRMETGQLELTLEPVQIRKVCERAIEQARLTFSPKNSKIANSAVAEADSQLEHHFTLAIEPDLDIIVADELRLRQMLIHLLANAFKFTASGGEIGLRVSYWAGWIAFTVWDTGIGIPEHQQHLIFQKFQQLETPLTRQFEGTGLGLVLTRALARLHGGDVSFLSKEGKGSQFTLLLAPTPPKKRAGEAGEADQPNVKSLPARRKHQSPSSDRSHNGLVRQTDGRKDRRKDSSSLGSLSASAPDRHLVLVVEAAPRFIEDLAEQLTSLGYWVAIARSGTEALEKARRLQPGVIFINPLLPLLSGWDVLTLLKSDPATSQIPIVVTTTRAEKNQALSHRADEFLSLPVQQQVLQQLMTRLCHVPSAIHAQAELSHRIQKYERLTILRLVIPNAAPLSGNDTYQLESSLCYCRILEADDLEQASLLARIWRPNAILLERAICEPLDFLQQLTEYPSLVDLPIVTLDPEIARVAPLVEQLNIFPCLTSTSPPAEVLLSALQMAAGISWEYSVLVLDVASLDELPDEHLSDRTSAVSIRAEWLQALIQYLQTAGFRVVMPHSWEEVQQQIQQQNVDLMLVCLGELQLVEKARTAIAALEQQQHKLPPIVAMERLFTQNEVREQFPAYLEAEGRSPLPSEPIYNSGSTTVASDTESIERALGAIATKVLPSYLSMEQLLDNIYQTLLAHPVKRG